MNKEERDDISMEDKQSIQTTNNIKKGTGITGSTLKIIAIAIMLIDHIGAVILTRALIQRGLMNATDPETLSVFLESNAVLYYTCPIFRQIGRIAFPIFCFLLVQGFLHTHNLKKYLGRLFLFALISELPFDLAFSGKLFNWSHQNVFFTLFFGILAIAGIRLAEQKKEWHIIWRVLFSMLVVGVCVVAVSLLKPDYDILGVLAIVIIYLFRRRKTLAVGIGCAVLMEIAVFISLIPIHLYNGERGRSVKWLFYLFYPVHILVLYLISCAMGLGQVML